MNWFAKKKAEKLEREDMIRSIMAQIREEEEELKTETDKDNRRVIRESLGRKYQVLEDIKKSKFDFWGKIGAAGLTGLFGIGSVALGYGITRSYYKKDRDPNDRVMMDWSTSKFAPLKNLGRQIDSTMK